MSTFSLVDWGANWRRRGGGRRQTHAEGWPATRTRRAWMAARSSQSSAVCGTATDWSRAPRLEPGVRSLLSVGRSCARTSRSSKGRSTSKPAFALPVAPGDWLAAYISAWAWRWAYGAPRTTAPWTGLQPGAGGGGACARVAHAAAASGWAAFSFMASLHCLSYQSKRQSPRTRARTSSSPT